MKRFLLAILALAWFGAAPVLAASLPLTGAGLGAGTGGPALPGASTSVGAIASRDVQIGITTAAGVTNAKAVTVIYSFWGTDDTLQKFDSYFASNTMTNDPNTACEPGGANGVTTFATSICMVDADNNAGFPSSYSASDSVGSSAAHGVTITKAGWRVKGWNTVMFAVDSLNQVLALNLNGVDADTSAATVPANLFFDLNSSKGLAITGRGNPGYRWLADVYISTENLACHGTSPVVTANGSWSCTGSGVFPAGLVGRIITGGVRQDLGATGLSFTGRQPEFLFRGGASTMATNAGTATTTFSLSSSTSSGGSPTTYSQVALNDAPYGPGAASNLPTHSAKMKWVAADPQASRDVGNLSMTTNGHGWVPAVGEFLTLVMTMEPATSAVHTFSAPTYVGGASAGFTCTAHNEPTSEILNSQLCYKFADANDVAAAGVYVLPFLVSTDFANRQGWVLHDYGVSVASVNAAGSGVIDNSTSHSQTTPATTTSAASTHSPLYFILGWQSGATIIPILTGAHSIWTTPQVAGGSWSSLHVQEVDFLGPSASTQINFTTTGGSDNTTVYVLDVVPS